MPLLAKEVKQSLCFAVLTHEIPELPSLDWGHLHESGQSSQLGASHTRYLQTPYISPPTLRPESQHEAVPHLRLALNHKSYFLAPKKVKPKQFLLSYFS